MQLVERDRQILHALSGRVIDGVRDCPATPTMLISPTMPISPTPLMPSGFTRTRLVDEDHFDVLRIRIHRQMIFGNVRVHDPAKSMIHKGLLVKRMSMPHATLPKTWLLPPGRARIRLGKSVTYFALAAL
jgi:hypothetical protein